MRWRKDPPVGRSAEEEGKGEGAAIWKWEYAVATVASDFVLSNGDAGNVDRLFFVGRCFMLNESYVPHRCAAVVCAAPSFRVFVFLDPSRLYCICWCHSGSAAAIFPVCFWGGGNRVGI